MRNAKSHLRPRLTVVGAETSIAVRQAEEQLPRCMLAPLAQGRSQLAAERGQPKGKHMKHRFVWASALALALTVTTQLQTMAITNGVIVITTRAASDALYRQISSSSLYDADDYKGPGVFSPGDTAMAILLQDYGYVTRLAPECMIRPDAIDTDG